MKTILWSLLFLLLISCELPDVNELAPMQTVTYTSAENRTTQPQMRGTFKDDYYRSEFPGYAIISETTIFIEYSKTQETIYINLETANIIERIGCWIIIKLPDARVIKISFGKTVEEIPKCLISINIDGRNSGSFKAKTAVC